MANMDHATMRDKAESMLAHQTDQFEKSAVQFELEAREVHDHEMAQAQG
jgi:hypothetical protein